MEQTEKRTPPRLAAIPHTLVLNTPQSNKPAGEECRWGPHCPICAKCTPKAENAEDWNGQRENNQKRKSYLLCPKYSPVYDIPDRFSQQLKLEMVQKEKMEQLNLVQNLTLNLNWNINMKLWYKIIQYFSLLSIKEFK